MSINTVQSQPTPAWVNNIHNQPNKQQSTSSIKNIQQNSKQSNSQQQELNIKEQQQIQKLRQRDSEVRQHELAHKTTGGRYAGNINYTYQQGPDGRRYAVGGSVSMNLSAEPGEPEKTVEKAEQIRKAALAPAQPSVQDLKIAAKAARMKMEAKAKLKNPQAKNEGQNNSQNVTQLYGEQQEQSENTQSKNISLIA